MPNWFQQGVLCCDRTFFLRILGIDPGLTNTGYGVIDVNARGFEAVEGGVVRTKSDEPMEQRLVRIYTVIRDVIQEFKPEVVAVEDLHSRFAKTALLLGHARGVVVMAAGEAGLPVFNYQPTRAKNLVTGSGRADKAQIKQAVAAHLGNQDAAKNEHVADAFSIAICHAIMAGSSALEAIEAAK
jgi:crossover junction endodeoxyribonuclease RuvC